MPSPSPASPVPFTKDPLLAEAEAAVVLSGADPARALARGRDTARRAGRAGHREAAAVALRAMALAAREIGDLPLAREYLHEAIRTGEGHPRRVAQARMSLVAVHTELGRPAEALRIADAAEPYLSPLERAKLGAQRAVALMRLGRHREAAEQCDRAVAGLRGAGGADEARFLAGALLNRALAAAWLGDHRRAEADLSACLATARAAGLNHLAALAEANRPFLAARRGDIPAAFAGYHRVAAALEGYPERLAALRCDLAGALLAAHLPGEARALLDLAVPDLEAAGAVGELADARLLLARLELASGMPHQAAATAELARAELAAQGRDTSRADETALRARLAVSEPDRAVFDAMLACVDALAAAGHAAAADGLRLTAAETALRLGDTSAALHQLALLTGERKGGGRTPTRADAAHPPRERRAARDHAGAHDADGARHVPPGPGGGDADRAGDGEDRVVREHATALACALRGDRRAAFAAVARGLRAAGRSGMGLRDPMARAHAVKAGERLAALGVSLAVGTGQGRTVLAWAERWRGVAAAGRPRTVDCSALRAELARLPPSPAPEAARRDGALPADPGAALVEYVQNGDDLVAVVVSGGTVSLHALGPVRQAAECTVRLRYALRRACLRDGAPARGSVAREAEAADRLLMRPLAGALPGGSLVIVPSGPLHTLPWPVLPSLRGRPVCVADSAAAWLRAVRRAACRSPLPAGVAVVAGPGLAHAREEATIVARCHPGARVVEARADGVLRALATARIMHLAAHGTFHARSPLLSGIELDDGPLMAYDLRRLGTAPPLVVLSACESGMAHAPADGAPLGLAGTFLERGATCVVAGMTPVRDEDAVELMAAFHTALAAGATPARALAEATERTGVAGFMCFGAGDVPVSPPPPDGRES